MPYQKSILSAILLCLSWTAHAQTQAPTTPAPVTPPVAPAPAPAQPAGPALTIDQAVQTALVDNLTLRNARLEIQAARARIGAARSGEFPQVNATGQYTHLEHVPSFTIPGTSAPLTITPQDNIVGTVTGRLALYTGGRIRAQVSRAEALYDATVARLASTEEQVAFQTRSAYYGVLLSQSLIRSNEAILAAARAQLAAAQARFEAGTAPRFDVLRAQTQVSQAEQNLTQAQNQGQTSIVALNRILGVPLSRTYTLTEPATAPAPTESLDALIATAESQRPEILAAQAQVVATRSGIQLARSELLPELDAVATYTMQQKISPVQPVGWSFSAVLTWALFNGGRASADVREAKALTAEAQNNLEDTRRAVEQEVRQSYADVQTAAANVVTARTGLAQAQEAYDIATVRYEAGVGTATELADALASLSTARTNLDRAIFNYNIAYAALQRALGRVTY